MQTFDQSIHSLFKKDLITYDEALRRASNPDEFKLKMQGIQSTSDLAQEEMEKGMTDLSDGGGGGGDSPFEFN
jgi:twitching motility protein PilT